MSQNNAADRVRQVMESIANNGEPMEELVFNPITGKFLFFFSLVSFSVKGGRFDLIWR